MFAANLKPQRSEPTARAAISRRIESASRRQGWSVYYLAIKRENNMAGSNLHFCKVQGCLLMSWSRKQDIQAVTRYETSQACSNILAIRFYSIMYSPHTRRGPDVWLAVHRNSVWIRKTN